MERIGGGGKVQIGNYVERWTKLGVSFCAPYTVSRTAINTALIKTFRGSEHSTSVEIYGVRERRTEVNSGNMWI